MSSLALTSGWYYICTLYYTPDSKVQWCKAVVKSIEKVTGFGKVVIATEKPTEFVVEETYLAGYSEKLDFLTLFLSSSLLCELDHIQQLLFYILVDSGSTHCFADVSFVYIHNLPTLSILSIELYLFDR